MIMSDFLVCMSHGSNDVGNAISPLIIIMNLEQPPYEAWISFFIGSLGIALGLLIYGEKVMATIGGDVIVLDYMKGFSSQFATAICVSFGSSLGIPLSTTHCIVGALAGVHIAGSSQQMKKAYLKTGVNDPSEFTHIQPINDDSEVAPPPPKDESSTMNLETIKKIVTWWFITVPCALVFTASLGYVLLHFA